MSAGADAPGVAVLPVLGIGEIVPGDDLAALIRDAAGELVDGDILVVTSKILSKAEGRIVAARERDAAISAETVRVVATRVSDDGAVTRIVQNRLGIVSAAAGVDASNTPDGTVLLLPEDPDRSARELAARLRQLTGVRVGVVVSDTLGRPWREGQTDCAIGAGGVRVIDDLRGTTDAEGRRLSVTAPCVGDELAGAGDLVKGKNTRIPVVVVRGRADLVGSLGLPGAGSIIRPIERDLFSRGAREAYEDGYAAGVAAARAGGARG